MKNENMDTKQLRAKLWRIFSEYIRLRDSDNQEGEWGVCISCNQPKTWGKNWQAGHFIAANKSLALKYDEKNVNGQCLRCNKYLSSNALEYERGMIKKYGADVIDYIAMKKNSKTYLGRFVYIALIEEYTDKLKQLKGNL